MRRSISLGVAFIFIGLLSSKEADAWPVHGVAACLYGTSYVNGLGVGDGCAGAQVHGSGLDRTFLTDSAQSGVSYNIPSQQWNFAGINYPTGHDPTLPLTDAATTIPGRGACNYADASIFGVSNAKYISCTASTSDLDIERFDFSNGLNGSGVPVIGGCIFMRITLQNGHNLILKNNHFRRASNCYGNALVTIVNGTGTRTVEYNTFDGNYGGTVVADSSFSFTDNSASGNTIFEYNYCPGQQDQCLDEGGSGNPGIIARYNFNPSMTLISGVWVGTGTVNGNSFTVNSTSGGYPPVPGQKLYVGPNTSGTLLGEIDSCTSTTQCTLHTASGTTYTNVTMNTTANHQTYFAVTDNASNLSIEDYQYNTGAVLGQAQPGGMTSTFEFNGGGSNQILPTGIIANNLIVINASGVQGSNAVTAEEAIFHDSLGAITNLTVTDNLISPYGAEFCMHQARITTISGTISNGASGAGDILNVTATPSQNIRPGSTISGSTIPSSGLNSNLIILPFGTGGTTGTGGAGTYIVYDRSQGTPAPASLNVTLSGASLYGSIGQVQGDGTVSGYTVARNSNILTTAQSAGQSAITVGGPDQSSGTAKCYGSNQ